MATRRRWLDEAEAEEEANRQTASLAGIAITLLLLVIGLFLIRELHAKAQIEDCLMAGRSNCDILVHAALWGPM
jgi:hypothetical protein